MNGPGDIPLTHHSTTTQDAEACSLISIIPILDMSSCRGRAEAFARRLSSKLRTLGSQAENEVSSSEDEPIINGGSENTWVTTGNDLDHTVTNTQPLRNNESDSLFDFDCELESPGSPVEECGYLRLVETASNTPHYSASESGYACMSSASNHSSTDGPYFDATNVESSSSLTDCSLIKQSLTTSETTDASIIKNALSPDSIHANTTSKCNCNDVNSDHPNEVNEQSNENEIQTDTNEHFKMETIINSSELDLGPSKCELNSVETMSIQDQIIQKLQKESKKISLADDIKCSTMSDHDKSTVVAETNTESNSCNSILENKSAEDELTSTKTNAFDISYSNGHTEVENELTKTEFLCTQENTTEGEEIKSNNLPKISTIEKSSEANNMLTQKEETHLSAVDTTDDEDDCRPQRVRRCSSLKTGKTPPGTPGRKKFVRFADVLGLDLADIKTFLDEIPTIPKSAFEDLEVLDSEAPIQLGPKSDKLLVPLFQQPGGLPTFLDLVREKQVSLENAAVTDHINQTIIGTVRVRNLDFHKSVHIRYTLDNWRSYADLQANYSENTCDGFSDKFTFTLFGNTLQIGQRLEFAVRFQCKGQQFWDNNYGVNYCFQCMPSSSLATTNQPIVPSTHHNNNLTGLLSPTAGDAWCSSFY